MNSPRGPLDPFDRAQKSSQPESAPPGDTSRGLAHPVQADTAPHGALWLLYLYFRPGQFVRHFVVDTTAGLTALCGWLYGIAGMIDHVLGETPGSSMFNSWGSLWGAAILGGAIHGYVYYGIGGWWYIVRLEWCGVVEPDKQLARRVYMFTSLAWALPVVVATAADTVRYAGPVEAQVAASLGWYGLILLALAWSLWASYRGVLAAFEASRGLAFLWFIGVPILFYGGVIVVMLFASLAMPADVDHPLSYKANTMTFKYPGNWWIAEDDPDHDPDYWVIVEPMQDALMSIMVYSTVDRQADLDAAIEELGGFLAADSTTPLTSLGRLQGQGQSMRGTVEGIPSVARVFITPIGDGYVAEIRQYCAKADWELVDPGLRLIADTLRFSVPE